MRCTVYSGLLGITLFVLLPILPAAQDAGAGRAKQEAASAGLRIEKPQRKDFVPFTQKIPGTDISFEMMPIPGGVFTLGSPESEAGRKKDEGPQRRVRVKAFFLGKHEVTWDQYELWMLDLDRQRRKAAAGKATARDKKADAVTRPTKPYTDMTFGMGHYGYPAICMTQRAASTYCEWLSAKTGKTFRLPTEAEWEWACRAGTTTRFSFGDDESKLAEYAWYDENSPDGYQKIGTRKPNPWGLYDMHGNVAEWVQDQYFADGYARFQGKEPLKSPVHVPTKLYPRIVRGGSWYDEAALLRCAARMASNPDWKMQDPQIPQSVWYHTDAPFVGFRLLCELPPKEGKAKKLPPKEKASR